MNKCKFSADERTFNVAVYKVSVVELDGWEKYKMEIKSDIACMWLSELLCELNALSVLKGGSAAVWQWVLQGATCCGEG